MVWGWFSTFATYHSWLHINYFCINQVPNQGICIAMFSMLLMSVLWVYVRLKSVIYKQKEKKTYNQTYKFVMYPSAPWQPTSRRPETTLHAHTTFQRRPPTRIPWTSQPEQWRPWLLHNQKCNTTEISKGCADFPPREPPQQLREKRAES